MPTERNNAPGKPLLPSETASEYFETLEAVTHDTVTLRKKYALMGQVLNNAINQKLQGVSIVFSGLFSKIQYLVREYDIDKSVAHAVNDTRVRLRNIEQTEDDELSSCCYYDLKAVCKWISILYGGAPIPQSLAAHFPIQKEQSYKRRVADIQGGKIDCLRCAVDRWDESFLYVTIEDTGQEARVDYTHPHEYNLNADWSYIATLLEQGDVLNLIKPREDNGIIYPELIIYTPDYLVNVTTVASCFEEYGDSYLMNLLGKITPSETTQPMLLGNFAGQMLDEACYHEKVSYAESVTRFFKKNALSFACCSASFKDFHTEAQKQKQNIEKTIVQDHKIHRKNGNSISEEELILEPSYFCATLGLQGRMDFIHYNLDAVIEQKSGKGAWAGRADVLRQQRKHYVQLLLYRAIFHYAYKRVDYDKLASWLFYSKYPEGLVELGSSPQLLFEALKTRNLIVWSESLYAKQGVDVLDKLTADSVFPGVRDESYLKWTKPRIERSLSVIRQATPLEKAYYFRFMRFISCEHMLSKIGNRSKEDAGFATMWNSSLPERKQAGNIYDKLSIELLSGEGQVESVTFRFAEEVDQDTSNFRIGDIVVFYPYAVGDEPNVTSSIVFRSTIARMDLTSVEVSLRNPQNKRVFDCIVREYEDNRKPLAWAIEHDFMEASYASLYRGMYAFLNAPKERRDLILGQRTPRIDDTVRLTGDYKSDEFNDLVLRTKQAQDLYLIVGPPGTGKTSYGMLNVLLEHLSDPSASVLLMAYTNRAVDEICGKLVEQGLDFIRIGSELNCSAPYRKYLLENRLAAMPRVKMDAVRDMMTSCRIFCGTTTSFSGKTEIFNLKRFDLAIIDEASQILEPFVMGLLSATRQEDGHTVSAIGKFVLIGDEKQLPAVVQQEKNESVVNDSLLRSAGLTDCRLSLFERFLRLLGKGDERYCHVLTRQGRMHPDIAVFPNVAFYQNTLRPVPLEHQLESTPTEGQGKNALYDMLLTHRVTFLSCPPAAEADEGDKVNSAEAQVIAALVVQGYLMMQQSFDINTSIGVIVPYRNQISAIRGMIDKLCRERGIDCLHDIAIDTVERYQGSQRDLIIYGFTAKKRYQLDFLANNEYYDAGEDAVIDRKLNVAMTRARKHLVLVGNDQLLRYDFTFRKLIDYCKDIQSFFHVSPEQVLGGEV